MATAFLIGWFLLGILCVVGVSFWGRRIWRRRAEYSLLAKAFAAVVFASTLSGALGTVAGLLKAFTVVGGESVEPSQKARIVAEGIASAMNCTSVAAFVWLASALALFLITRRARKGSGAG